MKKISRKGLNIRQSSKAISLYLLGTAIDGCYFWNGIKYPYFIFLLSRILASCNWERSATTDAPIAAFRFMRRYHCIDRRGRPRQVRVNWIMFRLRRFARHFCISYWQRIITASGRFAARCKSLPLHFRENLYRKYAEEGTTPAVPPSPTLSLVFSRPMVIGIIARKLGDVLISRL